MLLALDVGNSCISIGVFKIDRNKSLIDDSDLICSFNISTRFITSDEYIVALSGFLKFNGIGSAVNKGVGDVRVDCSIISSVVPALTDTLAESVKAICGSNPLIVGRGIRTGFGIKLKNPEQLGADIVSNVTAALTLSEVPVSILDVGTATTITVVDKLDKEPCIVGIVIMPGVKISMNALSLSAAQLNDVSLELPEALLGRDTSSSIRSGVINGHVYAIDGFIRNIREELQIKDRGCCLSLISTGGLADRIIPHTRNKFRNIEALTLIGSANLFLKNTK